MKFFIKVLVGSFLVFLFLWFFDTNKRIKHLEGSMDASLIKVDLTQEKLDLAFLEDKVTNSDIATKEAQLEFALENKLFNKQVSGYERFTQSFPVSIVAWFTTK